MTIKDGVQKEQALGEFSSGVDALSPGHDISTMSELTPEQIDALCRAIKTFCYLNVDNRHGFTWDMKTISLCEFYMDAVIKPMVELKRKGGKVVIHSMRKLGGNVWTTDKQVIAAQCQLISFAGVVFGQALAQMYGAKWHYDPIRDNFSIKHADWQFNAVQKPMKYLLNGGEDSLVGMAKALPHKAANDSMRKQMSDHIEKQKPGFLADCYAQDWHTDGVLTSTHWINSKGETVLVSVYDVLETA